MAEPLDAGQATAAAPLIRVDVVVSVAPARMVQCTLALPQGASLHDAQAAIWPLLVPADQQAVLAQAARKQRPLKLRANATGQAQAPANEVQECQTGHVALFAQAYRWGVWGRLQAPEHVLAEGDRIEAYRHLTVDPKVARRERFAKQGARGTGLFANQRKNAKSGY